MIKTYSWHDPAALKKMIELLQKNNVIVGTSDTVPGLLAPLTKRGYDILNHIKQRSDKPYLILAANTDQLAVYTDMFAQENIRQLANTFWPGPLTLIVPAKNEVPLHIKSKKGGVAMRIPKHEGLLQLLAQTGPLFSTSANISGKPVPYMVDDIDSDIIKQIAMLIKNGTSNDQPSTIIDCMSDRLKIIREGAISKQRLQGFLNEIND